MKKTITLGAIALFLALPLVAGAASFTLYPGAKPYHQSKLTPEEVQAQKYGASKGITQDSWTTPDSYDKVAAFYAKLYKSQKPAMVPQGVKMTFFILDGEPSIATSKRWVKVQRPLMAGFTTQGGHPRNLITQDITLIEFIHPK